MSVVSSYIKWGQLYLSTLFQVDVFLNTFKLNVHVGIGVLSSCNITCCLLQNLKLNFAELELYKCNQNFKI